VRRDIAGRVKVFRERPSRDRVETDVLGGGVRERGRPTLDDSFDRDRPGQELAIRHTGSWPESVISLPPAWPLARRCQMVVHTRHETMVIFFIT